LAGSALGSWVLRRIARTGDIVSVQTGAWVSLA
jgi:hypothetical protein